jgi:hypothetical protein
MPAAIPAATHRCLCIFNAIVSLVGCACTSNGKMDIRIKYFTHSNLHINCLVVDSMEKNREILLIWHSILTNLATP